MLSAIRSWRSGLGAGTVSDEVSPDRLSTAELHDLAVRHALRHLDIRFFWRLAEVLPVAEAGAGELREAEADVAAEADIATISAHLDDITDSGRGGVAELLRPFYLEYLKQHRIKAPDHRTRRKGA